MTIPPVTLVSGWLGAGKTTLLNRVIAEAGGRRLAVMQNEFGSAGIDGDLIEGSIAGLYELSGGCICCSVHDDFLAVLEEMLELDDPPEHVLIETSGVADPTTLLYSLVSHPWFEERFTVDGVVSVVDASTLAQTLSEVDEASAQVAAADLVLLNKCDLVDATVVADARDVVAQINPDVDVLQTTDGDPQGADLLALGRFDPTRIASFPRRDRQGVSSTVAGVNVVVLHEPVCFGQEELLATIGAILDEHGDRLYRLKGLVDVGTSDRTLLLQGVRSRFSWRFIDRAPEGSRMVLIGRGIDATDILSRLRRSVRQAEQSEDRG